MKDQVEESLLTNSFISSNGMGLLVCSVILLGFVYSLHFVPSLSYWGLLGAIAVVSCLSWICGLMDGDLRGVVSTMLYLISEKIVQKEVVDGLVEVYPERDLVYFDSCPNCEKGLLYNPSVSKSHRNDTIDLAHKNINSEKA